MVGWSCPEIGAARAEKCARQCRTTLTGLRAGLKHERVSYAVPLAPGRMAEPRAVGAPAVWALLFLRIGLAVVFQAGVAIGFLLAGSADPWRAAADWWLAWFAAVSVINLAVLRTLLHREGKRLRDLYRPSPHGRGTDLKWVVLGLAIAGPAVVVPNLVVGNLLWGSAQMGADLSFRPLPVMGAAILVVTFPVIHALAELPTYFGFVMPRLVASQGWRLRAVVVTALVLSTQHVVLPLLFDWRFIVWRALMFLPFALWIGFVVYRRPTTLPYLVIGHALLDASLPILILIASIQAA